ncbi:MAG: hypothetical protein H6757_04845 [Candidatus Omnitrophica bacterium]|nr:hypothetical protein [Candidatus Omnitrophota bacterium]
MNIDFFLDQVIGLVGAFLVLLAYFLLQTRRLSHSAYPYLFMNFFGGTCLLIASMHTGQAGLILLEGSWTVISLYALLKRMRGTDISGHAT